MTHEIEFRNDIELVEVDDSKHVSYPKGCKVTQIAIRRAAPHRNGKRFLIRKDLWEKLSPFQGAGLLTHELFYEHLSKLGENDSTKARQLNALLYTAEFDKQKFWKATRDLRLPLYP